MLGVGEGRPPTHISEVWPKPSRPEPPACWLVNSDPDHGGNRFFLSMRGCPAPALPKGQPSRALQPLSSLFNPLAHVFRHLLCAQHQV